MFEYFIAFYFETVFHIVKLIVNYEISSSPQQEMTSDGGNPDEQ